MLIDSPNKSYYIKLGGAKTTNELTWIVSYLDTTRLQSLDGTTSGATPVVMVDGLDSFQQPPENVNKLIKNITILNEDTVPQTVYVYLDNNSTIRNEVKILLAVGYSLRYENGNGWYVQDTNGAQVNIEISLTALSIGETVVGSATNKILYVDGANTLQQITLGTNISLAGSTLNVTTMGGETLAQTLVIGNLTGGTNMVLTDGDSITNTSGDSVLTLNSGLDPKLYWDNTAGTGADAFLSIDTNTIQINNSYANFFGDSTNAGISHAEGFFMATAGGITSTQRGIQMNSSLMYLYHETKITLDSPIYNFASLTASTVPYLDASKNLVSSAVTPTQLGYLDATSSIQTQLNAKAPINNPTFTGTVTLAQNPASALQAATKQYVDELFLGQNFKEAAQYATVAALPAVVYANGTAGVGATLTGVAVGALSIDGLNPPVGKRVLIKNQVSTFQNGWYIVTVAGSGIAVFVLTRTTDANQDTDFFTGDSSFVVLGNTLSTTTWAYKGIDNPVIGTDAITFAQTGGQGSFVQGNGITITGTTIAVDLSVVVDLSTAQGLTNKTYNGNTITASTGTITLGATKTLTVSDSTTLATNSITFAGTEVLTLAATKSVTFADVFITSGAFSITLTATAATTLTLPTTGTLATLAGAEVFTNKTLTSPVIKTNLAFNNPANTFAYTFTPAAIVAARTLNLPLTTQTETLAVQPTVAYNTSATPTTTASTTEKMMGLAYALTPVVTGRVLIIVSLDGFNGTTGDGCDIQIRYGTGAAPANADAVTGTAIGGFARITTTSNFNGTIMSHAIATGLTVGTAYWFDIGYRSVTAGTFTPLRVKYTIIEL